jgi:hypothetical protein
MGWGCIRIGIVSAAFLVGLILIGPMRTSAGSDTLRLDEHVGTSLIVACNGGEVAVRHVGGAVQLECEKGKIVVVRDENKRVRPLLVKQIKALVRFD